MLETVLRIVRYRNRVDEDGTLDWPVVQVWLEEFQDIRDAADSEQQARMDKALRRIVRMGRAVRVRVRIITQRSSVDDLPSRYPEPPRRPHRLPRGADPRLLARARQLRQPGGPAPAGEARAGDPPPPRRVLPARPGPLPARAVAAARPSVRGAPEGSAGPDVLRRTGRDTDGGRPRGPRRHARAGRRAGRAGRRDRRRTRSSRRSSPSCTSTDRSPPASCSTRSPRSTRPGMTHGPSVSSSPRLPGGPRAEPQRR